MNQFPPRIMDLLREISQKGQHGKRVYAAVVGGAFKADADAAIAFIEAAQAIGPIEYQFRSMIYGNGIWSPWNECSIEFFNALQDHGGTIPHETRMIRSITTNPYKHDSAI